MKLNKFFAILIAVMMLFTCVIACTKSDNKEGGAIKDRPTVAPTAEITEKPTEAPTEEPTAVPTEEPTAVPTQEPTAEPTQEPTEPPIAVTGDYQVIDNEYLHLEVPATWERMEEAGAIMFTPASFSQMELIGYMVQEDTGFDLNTLILGFSYISDDELSELISQMLSAQLESSSDLYTINKCSVSETEMNGNRCMLLTAEVTMMGIEVFYDIYYFFHGDDMVCVICMLPIGSEYGEAISYALSSLVIKP